MKSNEHQALFEQLVRQHSDSVFRFAFRSLGDWHDAEDHVNDVFEQVWKNIDTLRDQAAAKSWLFSICRNRLATKITRLQKRRMKEIEEEPKERSAAEIECQENQDLIQFAASKLDPKMLEVVLLVEMEQFSVTDVANLLDVPRGTVLSRLHRGKAKFRDVLNIEEARFNNPIK